MESYSTDNGIYTSMEFTRELHGKVQGINNSVVGGHHHNGVKENAINNVLILSRTMTINDAIRWPDVSQKSLWPMAMYHAVNLHDHTPHISSGMYIEKLWTRYKYYHSALQNDNPRGLPAYVLEPSL